MARRALASCFALALACASEPITPTLDSGNAPTPDAATSPDAGAQPVADAGANADTGVLADTGSTQPDASLSTPDSGSSPADAGAPEPTQCGGFAGLECPRGLVCDQSQHRACGADMMGVCIEPRNNPCPEIYQPVCGCDGVTYANECERLGSYVALRHEGACQDDANGCGGANQRVCPRGQLCDRSAHRVCAEDLEGVCRVSEPVACPAIYAPVCGCNGQTYGNDCERRGAGAALITRGRAEHTLHDQPTRPCRAEATRHPPRRGRRLLDRRRRRRVLRPLLFAVSALHLPDRCAHRRSRWTGHRSLGAQPPQPAAPSPIPCARSVCPRCDERLARRAESTQLVQQMRLSLLRSRLERLELRSVSLSCRLPRLRQPAPLRQRIPALAGAAADPL